MSDQISTIRKITMLRGRCFLMLLVAVLWCTCLYSAGAQISPKAQEDKASGAARYLSEKPADSSSESESTEDRIKEIEKTLESIKQTGEKAEDRSYFNKMASLELIRFVKIMVVLLIVIAIVFPFTLYFLSRRRLLGLSGLSTEVTATLLLVEERQAKLANVLKEIQSEIDYMQSMSAPDLRKLIEQAEKYLKQNERDLKQAGSNYKRMDVE